LGAASAGQAIAGSWHTLAASGIAKNIFYVKGIGLDQPAANFWRMLLSGGVTLLTAFALAGAAKLIGDRKTLQIVAGSASGILIIVGSWWLPVAKVAYGLPVVSVFFLAVILVIWFRRRGDPTAGGRLLMLAIWSIFALAMIGKMVLNTRFGHYGFYLAAPATLVLVVLLLWAIPCALGGGGRFYRATAVWLLLAIVVAQLNVSQYLYRLKTYPVGKENDRIIYYHPNVLDSGIILQSTMDWITQNTPAEATVLVLPVGIMINYLTRRVCPSPYFQLSIPKY